jgi:hypothetical protein
MNDSIDYLDEDKLRVPDQNYVCISFLTPDKDSDKIITGIKVRGVFKEYDEACQHAKQLQDEDKYFDVFVGELGKWLPFNPKPDSKKVKDFEYATKELNEIMKGYKNNQEKAKLFHEQRKNAKVKDNINENIQRQYENKKNLEEKLNEDLDENEKKLVKFNLENIDNELDKMNKRKGEIEEMEKNLMETLDLTTLTSANNKGRDSQKELDL